jgi:hypothetical protein
VQADRKGRLRWLELAIKTLKKAVEGEHGQTVAQLRRQ